MSKHCASCGKQVYPVEELKCSDQVYHKGCFRCITCNLQLNLKNFKISESKPYCSTHYPTQRTYTVVKDTPEMDRVAKNMQVVSKVAYTGQLEKRNEDEMRRPPAEREIGVPPKPRVGSIADYDPMARQPAAPAAQPARAPQPQMPPPQPSYQPPQQSYQPPPAQPAPAPVQAAPARASGYGYGQPASAYAPEPQRAQYSPPEPEPEPQRQSYNQRESYHAPEAYNPPPQAAAYDDGAAGARRAFRAVYEYVASDNDEVSFNEGDLIVDGEPIDDGWMYGTVQRTGKRGMLPSNYVEPI